MVPERLGYQDEEGYLILVTEGGMRHSHSPPPSQSHG